MCWRQCDTGGWARPQLPATAAHTASSATSHSRHNQPHTAWPLAHTGPWPGHYSKVCMCCPVPGSSWSPPHPVPPRHGRQMPRVRGVLQPRPGQHTSTPLAAEVTPSHNRQPAAPPRCHLSRVTLPCQYYHYNAQPQVMHLSRLHHHQPSPARWWLAIRPGSQ